MALSVLVGSTIGLGLGHTIQGRYNDRGWLTIAEISSLYIMGAGFIECDAGFGYLFGRKSAPTPVNQNGCALIKMGSFLYLGLRIFEFVDLIRFIPTTKRINTETAPSVYFLPQKDSASLLVSLKF